MQALSPPFDPASDHVPYQWNVSICIQMDYPQSGDDNEDKFVCVLCEEEDEDNVSYINAVSDNQGDVVNNYEENSIIDLIEDSEEPQPDSTT